jgi:hypothetical protein
MRRCDACGARVPEGARWCSLCHAPFAGPLPPVVPPPARWSRWQGDDVTLGRRARVWWTVGILLPPLVVLHYAGAFGIAFALMWWCLVTPVVLRDVWRRARL